MGAVYTDTNVPTGPPPAINDLRVTLRGHLVFDETVTAKRPGVVVFHEGLGLGDFAIEDSANHKRG